MSQADQRRGLVSFVRKVTGGDIDAGRGAKTTRVPTRPEIMTDANGNTTIVEKPDIGGSGIGTIEGFAGEPGDVDLIAPKGTVNAAAAMARRRTDRRTTGGRSAAASTATILRAPSICSAMAG